MRFKCRATYLFRFTVICSFLSSSTLAAAKVDKQSWQAVLAAELKKIDADTPGKLGVYVKRLSDGSTVDFDSQRDWYLASTVKVPIAVILLQMRQEGLIRFEEELTVQQSDYVDGSGEVNWKEPGSKVSIRSLFELMRTKSDSAATDMLIRRLSLPEINSRLAKIIPGGFTPLTTILQVRYDAYSELHPRAKTLTNMDFFEIKKLPTPEAKLAYLVKRMKIRKSDLKARTIDEAFERYYERKLNSSELNTFGLLLEKVAVGQILSSENRDLLLSEMEKMTTGEKRIKAGMPLGSRFAQKTGTQVRRICNMGIVRSGESVIIAACLEKFHQQAEAEAALARVGQALVASKLFQNEGP